MSRTVKRHECIGTTCNHEVHTVRSTYKLNKPCKELTIELQPGDPERPMSLKEKYVYLSRFKNSRCNCIDKYVVESKIGEGTFGEVYKGHERTNPQNIVAIKKPNVDFKQYGFPLTSLREIMLLQKLNHENVVKLIEICFSKPMIKYGCTSSVYLVLEFCHHDLAGVLGEYCVRLTSGEKKSIILQMLTGIAYMHEQKVFHRDLKTANMLISKQGILKLADLGLARVYENTNADIKYCFTNCVVTLWYRPPELLLGEHDYGPEIDMWSIGCIIGEVWTRTPIMSGRTEQQQLQLIVQLCGPITPAVWPKVINLPLYNRFNLPEKLPLDVRTKLNENVRDRHCLDLINSILKLDPTLRLDARTALKHKFFSVSPKPTDLRLLLSRIKGHLYSKTMRL